MKYLFFDIEAANSYVGESKICSFGYVLTDSKFSILEKNDIFINPKGKFKLVGRPNKKDFYLKYPEEFFRTQPTFDMQYPKIKDLLSTPNSLIVGYSVLNDIKMLRGETKFWRLEMVDFNCYDAQNIFVEFSSINQSMSLNLANDLLETNQIQEEKHDSLSDALLTMEITKTMCSKLSISLEELINLCPKCCFRVKKKVIDTYTLGERFPDLFAKLKC